MAKQKADKGVTLLAVNALIEGNVRFSGELYVNGSVVGDIVAEEEAKATLVVSEEGSVKGDIRVSDVVICGRVEGDLHANVRAEFGKNASLRGDLHYKLVEVHNGAVIDGRMVPQDATDANVPPVVSLPLDEEGIGSLSNAD